MRLSLLLFFVATTTTTTQAQLSTTTTPFWNNNDWPSDTTNGDLEGTVLFAQGQILPSKHGVPGDDTQPHLTALRQTLVLFQTTTTTTEEEEDGITMTVKDEQGTILASNIPMEHPDNIPKHDGWMPNVDPASLTFPDSLINPYVVQDQSNLEQTNNPDDQGYLVDILNNFNSQVQVKYRDGSWVSDLYLPDATTVPPDSKVWVTSNAGYKVKVNYPNTIITTGGVGAYRTQRLSRGTEVMMVIVNGAYWVAESDLQHNDYVFGHNFWTSELDATWVQPGLTLEFRTSSSNKSSQLVDIDIGGETELIITAIDVGFLTEPRNEFVFKDDETTHREYFQTIPASRLIVSQYESLHLTEVMLPTGVLYTTASTDTGGWHSGDMRQYTGKVLISHGIDMANYGHHSSSGTNERDHTFTSALLTGHNTVGMYANGRVVHGGSGGNGIITLDSSVGNELSHEAGHNFGLGHYVRGFEGSVHRSADQTGSTWGWDKDYNVLIPNFLSSDTDTAQDQCCCPSNENNQCEAPFLGRYQFGKDSMAGGGGGHWGINRFTLYTPNSYKEIQSFLERKLVFHSDSSTGFIQYNPTTSQMDEAPHHKRPTDFGVPVTTLVGYYDPQGELLADYIFPAMHGAYGFVYEPDFTLNSGVGCELLVQTRHAGLRVYELATTRFTSNVMNKFHVNVATADEVMSAEIQCDGATRAIRALNGIPSSELRVTRQGQETSRTFSPTAEPTTSPSVAPSFIHDWGLEQAASLEVRSTSSNNNGEILSVGDKSRLKVAGTEYYIPNAEPNVDIELDLGGANYVDGFVVTGAYLQSWYVTKITNIQVGVAAHNNMDGNPVVADPPVLPAEDSSYEWYDLGTVPGCCNKELEVAIPHVTARYVKFRIQGGSSSYSNNWGLRQIKVSGFASTTVTQAPTTKNPTGAPTQAPTAAPTKLPTVAPTKFPTPAPTAPPTFDPTPAPTLAPTAPPTLAPTFPPTPVPTAFPTNAPTAPPTLAPTFPPTPVPTTPPTTTPTNVPTNPPTVPPTTPPPTPAPVAVPVTPPPTNNNPTTTPALILAAPGKNCGAQYTNLGTHFASPNECAAAAAAVPGCGSSIMYSERYGYAWGCRCCTPDGAAGGAANNNWDVYSFDSAVTSLTLAADGKSCGRQFTNLGTYFSSPEECALQAATVPGCGSSFMYSEPYGYAWGCRCCTPDGAAGGHDNNNWDLYSFDG